MSPIPLVTNEEVRQSGELHDEWIFADKYTCLYHRVMCHNPLDCDLVPLYYPGREVRDRVKRAQEKGSDS